MKSRSTSATVNNLKPSTAYVFQIRAFTAAGYGTYGPRLEVTTKEEASGTSRTHAWACTHKGTHGHTHKHTHTHSIEMISVFRPSSSYC